MREGRWKTKTFLIENKASPLQMNCFTMFLLIKNESMHLILKKKFFVSAFLSTSHLPSTETTERGKGG